MSLKLPLVVIVTLGLPSACLAQGAGSGAGAAGPGGGQGGIGTTAGAGGTAVGGGSPAGPVGGGAPAGAVGGGAPGAAASETGTASARASQNPSTSGGVINLESSNLGGPGTPLPPSGVNAAGTSQPPTQPDDAVEQRKEQRRPAVGCTASARETDGTTTCIGERAGRH